MFTSWKYDEGIKKAIKLKSYFDKGTGARAFERALNGKQDSKYMRVNEWKELTTPDNGKI